RERFLSMPAKRAANAQLRVRPNKRDGRNHPLRRAPPCQMKSHSQSSGLCVAPWPLVDFDAAGYTVRLARLGAFRPAVASTCRDQLKPAAEVLWYVSAW